MSFGEGDFPLFQPVYCLEKHVQEFGGKVPLPGTDLVKDALHTVAYVHRFLKPQGRGPTLYGVHNPKEFLDDIGVVRRLLKLDQTLFGDGQKIADLGEQ